MADESVKPENTDAKEPTNDELLAKIQENPKETLKELVKKRADAQKKEQLIKDLESQLEKTTGKLTAKDKADAEAKAAELAKNGEFETLLKDATGKISEFEKNLADTTAKLTVFETREKAKRETLYAKLTELDPILAAAFSVDSPIEQLEAVLNKSDVKKAGFPGVVPPNTTGTEIDVDTSRMSAIDRQRFKIMNSK